MSFSQIRREPGENPGLGNARGLFLAHYAFSILVSYTWHYTKYIDMVKAKLKDISSSASFSVLIKISDPESVRHGLGL